MWLDESMLLDTLINLRGNITWISSKTHFCMQKNEYILYFHDDDNNNFILHHTNTRSDDDLMCLLISSTHWWQMELGEMMRVAPVETGFMATRQ